MSTTVPPFAPLAPQRSVAAASTSVPEAAVTSTPVSVMIAVELVSKKKNAFGDSDYVLSETAISLLTGIRGEQGAGRERGRADLAAAAGALALHAGQAGRQLVSARL